MINISAFIEIMIIEVQISKTELIKASVKLESFNKEK